MTDGLQSRGYRFRQGNGVGMERLLALT
jgi:hypothetical protein